MSIGRSHKLRNLPAVKPLYRIPESGLHWYMTYLHHHVATLGMHRSRVDHCTLISRNGGRLDRLVILQVDCSMILGTREFSAKEDNASNAFLTKPRSILGTDPTDFNGTHIRRNGDARISIAQTYKIKPIRIQRTLKAFASQRAFVQYIGVNPRPGVCANTEPIAPGAEETTPDEFKAFQKIRANLHETADTSMSFLRLTHESVNIFVITDTSFEN